MRNLSNGSKREFVENKVPLLFGYTTAKKLLVEIIDILEKKNGRKFDEKVNSKVCHLCGEEFPNSYEFFYPSGKGGKCSQSYCKDCFSKKYNNIKGKRKPKMKL